MTKEPENLDTEELVVVEGEAVESFDALSELKKLLNGIDLSSVGLDVPFLQGTGVANIKGEILDLSDLRGAAELMLKDIAKEAKDLSKKRLAPIGEWMQELITKRIPAIGKYYAKHVFAAGDRARGKKLDQKRLNDAKARVRTFIYREKAALDTLLRAIDLEVAKIAEITFWDSVEKAIPVFLKLGQLALTYVAPGISLV